MLSCPYLIENAAKAARGSAIFPILAQDLAERWAAAENLFAAYLAALPGSENRAKSIAARLQAALQKVEKTLQAQEKKYG